ncbi:TPA: hypothetical protein ACP9FK_002527 [Legionella anisa]|nr:hypothetical protein [Legionella anisa]MBN5936540.1 hypothetical protein [Legionella anisa]MCW8424826.1 hypothetical protein [Legionella anisa]MCW8446055.1 hypothetical protein [Legionella anisa]UAK80180.1 hypothetical protein K8O89_03650 [Legionella anisa]
MMFFNQKKIYYTLLLLGLYSSTASSAGHVQTHPPVHRSGYALLQAGGYWLHQGQAQHININGLIGDDFTVTNHNDENYLVGLAYFVDGHQTKLFDMSYGINAYYLAKTSVNGFVIQENLFQNLSYHYNVDHFPIYIMARAALNTKNPDYGLIIDAGIGPNLINARNFKEYSLDGQTLPDNFFSRDLTAQFSAAAGVHIKLNHVIRGGVPLECGYRFFYLGKGHFSSLNDQVTEPLSTGNTYANALICGLEFET